MALLAALVAWSLPRRVGYALCDGLAGAAYLVCGPYRRAVLDNLATLLGRPTSDPAVRRAARRCFQTSARNFFDLCRLPWASPGWLLRQIDIEPAAWERLAGALRRGRGVIVVTAHLGAFDYVGQTLTLLPSRPLILTAQTTAGWLFHAVTTLRAAWGGRVEPVTPGSIRRVLTYLRRGGMVGLVGDRDIAGTGHAVLLAGHRTTLPVGPVRLAQETGAPLLALFCPRVGDRYRLLVDEVPMQATGRVVADLEANLATLATLFETRLRQWPDQWVMFERLWRE